MSRQNPGRAKYDPIRAVVALKNEAERPEQMVGKLTLENDLWTRGASH